MSFEVRNNKPVIPPQTQVPVDGTQIQSGVDTQKIITDATKIIQGVGLNFLDHPGSVDGPRKTGGVAGKIVDIDELPELDDEAVENLLSVLDDLEKLIAQLKSESSEEQIALVKERIANLRDKLKQQHSDRIDKIDESMKQIDAATDAKKSQEKMGILSCVMAVVSALIAVVAVAAALFTGGASLAIGLAIVAGIGALCNVANAALTIYQTVEKDSLEQQVKDKAKEYRDQGMSSSEAWKKASSDVNDKFLIASICLSVGGMVGGLALGGAGSVGDLVKLIGIVQTGLSAASMVTSAVNAGISSDASDKSYDAQATQAELTQLEAVLERLKRTLDDENGDIQKLLQMLQEALAQLAQLLESSVSTTEQIAEQTGATA